MKKLMLSLLAVATFAVTSMAINQTSFSAVLYRFMNGAAATWVAKVNSTNQFTLTSQRAAALAVPIAIQCDGVTGACGILTVTATQLAALTPSRTNLWAFNTTSNLLFRSTGTAQSQWSAYTNQSTISDFGVK